MFACRFFLIIFCLMIHFGVLGQARLIFNGAYVNIENGARLVIDNPNPNAITHIDGHIISEHENDIVKWNIGDLEATYTVPFGYDTINYLPLTFGTINGSGTNGYFEFAMYGGPNYLNSSYLPSGITNFNGFGNTDNSAYVVDRFWLIRARNYASGNTLKPDIENLRFTYRDPEHTAAGNTINENFLWVQRYNPVLDSWYDYIPGNGIASVNPTANTVEVAIVPYDEVHDWWVLVDKINPLPVELLSFTASPVNNSYIQLDWRTANEQNSDYFIIERSRDAVNWEFVLTKKAAGNSNTTLEYTDIDPAPYKGLSYYRLKMVDFDQSYKYSVIVPVFIESDGVVATVMYPNPTQEILYLQAKGDVEGDHQLTVFDIQGRLMMSRHVTSQDLLGSVQLNVQKLAQGTYFLQVQGDTLPIQAFKFIKL
jgi:hypothetical protein